MPRTVARLLAESLEAHDVDQVYCVPGESYIGLTSALIDRNSIRVVVCRHEAGAGYMAVADGRLRDRAGVAIVSRGPGLSNAMVSLHSAYHDATPMVMLVGQVERSDFGRLALQEQNYSRLLSDITKHVIEVNEPEQASEAMARAFHIAESGTPGPVAVAYWVFISLLIVGIFIDVEHFIIPDEVTIGGIVTGLIASFLVPALMSSYGRWAALLTSALSALLGYVLLWIVLEAGKKAFGKKRIQLDAPTPFHWTRKGEDADFVVGDEHSLWSDYFSRESDVLILH